MRSAVIALCALAALASASTFTLESRTQAPSPWKQGARVAADAVLPFRVALRQQNLEKLDEVFWAVSTPGTPRYGQFLTSQEVNEMVASSPEDMAVAMANFNAHSGMSCKPVYDALDCTSTASAIEALFSTELHTYINTVSGKQSPVYTGSLTLPAALEEVVVLIEGFNQFHEDHIVAVRGDKPFDAAANNYVIVPEGVLSISNIVSQPGSPKIIQSVAEFVSEPAYTPAELPTFSKEAAVPTITVAKKVGPFAPGGDLESSLDIQYISSIGQGNTNWFITTTGWLYTFAGQWANATTTPQVISMSYGWYEGQQCQFDTANCKVSYVYVARVNTEFQKLGTIGITLLASAGDSGAHGRSDDGCTTGAILRPAFPAASPYVTAVGATMIKTGTGTGSATAPICTKAPYKGNCITGGTQIVASIATGAIITSGGGFSNVAPRPAYQNTVVAKYLQDVAALPKEGDFNATGRGFPDVSALGHNFFIEAGGATLVDGTSCSAPVWGGIMGLLNAYLVSNGKPVLGFANPTLYSIYASNPSAFVDITEGDNHCTEEVCTCSKGFTAVAGWDAASGLGAANYPQLLAGLKALKGIA